jgi:opacity protein-like surface antigen
MSNTLRHAVVRSLLPALLCAGAAGVAQADESQWSHAITPYVWGSGMSGQAALGTPLGPLEADVDVSFGDILENLRLGAMVAYRGDRGPWTVMGDLIYMELEADRARDVGPVRVDATANVEQIALEADVGYRWTEHVTVFAGLRYNSIDLDLDVLRTGPGAGARRTAGESAQWIDPLVGAIAEIPLAPRWALELRGDVGGFGVGADLAWQAVVTARWRATDSVDVVASYRYLDVDYEDGSGADLFVYDIATSGPGLGVTFRF